MPLARHPPPMTLAEFLAWEERQELRHEFDGFAPVAMTGGARAHETIPVNLLIALGGRLRGGPCRAYGGDLKIEVAGRIRYPDAFVTCGEPGAQRDTVERSLWWCSKCWARARRRRTGRTRRASTARRPPCGATSCWGRCAPRRPFAREGDTWTVGLLFRGDVLSVPEIGIEIPLDELCAGLDLDEPPAA